MRLVVQLRRVSSKEIADVKKTAGDVNHDSSRHELHELLASSSSQRVVRQWRKIWTHILFQEWWISGLHPPNQLGAPGARQLLRMRQDGTSLDSRNGVIRSWHCENHPSIEGFQSLNRKDISRLAFSWGVSMAQKMQLGRWEHIADIEMPRISREEDYYLQLGLKVETKPTAEKFIVGFV